MKTEPSIGKIAQLASKTSVFLIFITIMLSVKIKKLPLSEKQSLLRELHNGIQEKVAIRHQISPKNYVIFLVVYFLLS